MQDILSDIVRQTAVSKVEVVKVTGTDKQTRIQAVDVDLNLFIDGYLKMPLPEIAGEFGIKNLAMLNKLLAFPTYRAEGASLEVRRRMNGSQDVPFQLIFKDALGGQSIFQMMNADLVPKQADALKIPWDIDIEPSKAKITELTQLAGIFAEVDKNIRVSTANDNLVFHLGVENSSTDSASMVFEGSVSGVLKGELMWSVDQVLSLMKIAGPCPLRMMITSKGVLGTRIETPHATYNYYLKATR